MMGGQAGLVVLQFSSSVITARLLNPLEMGIFAVGIAILGLLGSIRALGLASFLIREPELDPRTVAASFTINALAAAVTASVTLLCSSLGASLLHDHGVQRVLTVLAIIPLVGAFDFLPSAMLERQGAFRALAFVNLIRSTMAATITITLASNGFTYMSMAWGNLAAAVVAAGYINVVGRRHVSLRVGLHDWRRITQFGVQMLTISLAGSLTSRLSDLVLGQVAGLTALGLYSRASGLNSLLWENVHLVISRIVFVDFAEHRRRSLSLGETYLRIVAMVTGLLWPAFGGLAIISGPLILRIYGPNWTKAALPLSMLSISSAILVSITMAGEIYMVNGQTSKQVRYELKRTITGLVLFVSGCFGGLAWASAARIAEATCTIAYCQADLKRMTRTAAADYRPIYAQGGLLALLACTPVGVLMAVNHWSYGTSLPALLCAITVGIVCWFAGLWSLQHPIFREVLSLAKRLPAWSA